MSAHWSSPRERTEPDDIRIHARYVYDSALSILDQTRGDARTRHEQEHLALLALDLDRASTVQRSEPTNAR